MYFYFFVSVYFEKNFSNNRNHGFWYEKLSSWYCMKGNFMIFFCFFYNHKTLTKIKTYTAHRFKKMVSLRCRYQSCVYRNDTNYWFCCYSTTINQKLRIDKTTRHRQNNVFIWWFNEKNKVCHWRLINFPSDHEAHVHYDVIWRWHQFSEQLLRDVWWLWYSHQSTTS